MCGIAGAVAPDASLAMLAAQRMTKAQAHRGPDDDGFASIAVPRGVLALGFRRLAIQDLSSAGSQPMRNASTGDLIVLNGEIYNFRELRKELEYGGISFRGRSDTEVLLHACARWEDDVFAHILGMYAFAFYRARDHHLLIARDPLGIKPLYLGKGKDVLVFASELRALRASGVLSGDLDPRAVAGFLAHGSVPEPLTMLKDAELVGAGCRIWVDLSKADEMWERGSKRRFWSIPTPAPTQGSESARDGLAEALRASVRSHLVSDVPVAIFLSSGIDSTAIAVLARGASPDPVVALTVTVDDATEDEAPAAARVARSLGFEHRCVTIGGREVESLVHAYLRHMDQPTVDGLNTFLVSLAARRAGVVVALSGLGGDELFGGYATFREVPHLLRYAKVTGFLPAAFRGLGARLLLAGRPRGQRAKGIDLAARARPTVRSVCLRRRRVFADMDLEALGFDTAELGLDEEYTPPEAEAAVAASSFSEVRAVEMCSYMKNMLLRDADVFGMAHGIEIRVPLLDQRVVDRALRDPGDGWVDSGLPNKHVLVEAAGGIPPEVMFRAKRGFGLRQAEWMRGPLRPLFADLTGKLRCTGILDEKALRRIGDREATEDDPGWSRYWALAALGAWIDGHAEETAPARAALLA